MIRAMKTIGLANFTSALAICGGCALSPLHWANAQNDHPAAKESAAEVSALEGRLLRQGLSDVQILDPSIQVDLKYAKTHNFMGANVYDDLSRAYLRPAAARKLADASALLQERHPNLRLLVVDAVRPRFVQHRMWKIVAETPMQPYVANPHRGSMHNYGAAVDVTLYDIESEVALDMGTPVDYFGPLAQPNLEPKFLREGKLSTEQVENRLILRQAMLDAGWNMLAIEWWHFDAFPKAHTRRTYSIIE
jgi:zinc D-Ala-D-Ala dipeptidase